MGHVCCLQQCFEAVLQLLEWSWSASHTAMEVDGLKGDGYQAALADMSRLVYISRACLRLLRIYVNEVYPDGGEPEVCESCSRVDVGGEQGRQRGGGVADDGVAEGVSIV